MVPILRFVTSHWKNRFCIPGRKSSLKICLTAAEVNAWGSFTKIMHSTRQRDSMGWTKPICHNINLLSWWLTFNGYMTFLADSLSRSHRRIRTPPSLNYSRAEPGRLASDWHWELVPGPAQFSVVYDLPFRAGDDAPILDGVKPSEILKLSCWSIRLVFLTIRVVWRRWAAWPTKWGYSKTSPQTKLENWLNTSLLSVVPDGIILQFRKRFLCAYLVETHRLMYRLV